MAAPAKPHLVFFPFPAQGHVTAAFQLARLLHRWRGFDVTFVHTEHNRRRLLRARGPDALAGEPGFRFVAVPDGLPPSDEDAAQEMVALVLSLPTMVPHFKMLVASELPAASCCLVSDVDHILRVVEEIGLPCITFWTASASSFMAYQQCQHLVAKGLVPLKDAEQLRDGHLDSTVVDWVPGFPKGMRLKDFPSFIRTTNPDDAALALTLRSLECHRTIPSAIIFHTFEELESGKVVVPRRDQNRVEFSWEVTMDQSARVPLGDLTNTLGTCEPMIPHRTYWWEDNTILHTMMSAIVVVL